MNHKHYLHTWLKEYYRRTSRLLKCPKKTRQRMIDELHSSVEEYLDEHPTAAPSDIVQHLGTPDQIAYDYLSSLDERELNEQVSRAKTMRRVLVLIAIVLIISSIFIFILYRNWKENISYFNDFNVFEGTTEVEDDE